MVEFNLGFLPSGLEQLWSWIVLLTDQVFPGSKSTAFAPTAYILSAVIGAAACGRLLYFMDMPIAKTEQSEDDLQLDEDT